MAWIRQVAAAVMLVGVGVAATQGQSADKGALRVYFADVEGGQATLFVTPLGESLLVDTGWAGSNGRDAARIDALCDRAGIHKIDNVLITHYHDDHVGGVPQLAAKVPIGRFFDHGDNREVSDAAQKNFAAYRKVLLDGHSAHQVVKVGDVLPLKGIRAEVVSADGEVLGKPLAAGGAGQQNPACARTAMRPAEDSENDRSVGLMITFGKLRVLDLGDLTWAKERPLMCPVDKLGRVDVYIVSHHGMDRSGSEALVDAVAPRVAIMDNGATKGASQPAWEAVSKSPRIADGKGAIWQLHTAIDSDAAHNVPAARIANLSGPDAGHSLELAGHKDGSFAVRNERTGETVQYPIP
ncbi:MAG: beta-lactamase-like protein [Acidobacteriaceae bacterium]|nr:beta-lactamase-like protein [Acidobacteriaceae bacterium]